MDITGPRCILVLGTHRTGTSLVAGILHHLGVNMGDEMKPAHPTNPAGHFEDMDFLTLNDQVVGDWRNPTIDYVSPTNMHTYEMLVEKKTSRLWGIKDPRLCITAKWILPYLEKYGNQVKVVTTHRPSKAVHASLRARNPLTLDQAERITATYTSASTRFLQSFPGQIHHTHFGDFLDVTFAETAIGQLVDFVFDRLPRPDDQQIANAVAHIDPDLRHF